MTVVIFISPKHTLKTRSVWFSSLQNVYWKPQLFRLPSNWMIARYRTYVLLFITLFPGTITTYTSGLIAIAIWVESARSVTISLTMLWRLASASFMSGNDYSNSITSRWLPQTSEPSKVSKQCCSPRLSTVLITTTLSRCMGVPTEGTSDGRYLRERLWGFRVFGADYIRGRTSVGGFVPCCCWSVALRPQKP